jgi:tRNA nucleotidyltransferase (CCA-adding enzyme)
MDDTRTFSLEPIATDVEFQPAPRVPPRISGPVRVPGTITAGDISIVIPVKDNQAGIDRFLASGAERIDPAGRPREIIIVDNDSDEMTQLESACKGEERFPEGPLPDVDCGLEFLSARRDFTMNALAFDPLAIELRDPFGGKADLERGRIRAVGDPAARFGEDGLRPMRAVRFVAQLGFELEPETRRAIPGALPVVKRVAMERITDELGKLLVAPHVERAVRLLGETELLGVILPKLSELPASELRHAAAVAKGTPPVLAIRLASLLHGLGPDGAASALFGLRLSRQTSEAATALVRFFPCRLRPEPGLPAPEPPSLRRWVAKVEPLRVEPLLGLAAAEARAAGPLDRKRGLAEVTDLERRIAEVLKASPPLSTRELALDGLEVAAILGAPPGPRVGEALRYLLDRVLEDPAENEVQRLRAALLDWSAQSSGRI